MCMFTGRRGGSGYTLLRKTSRKNSILNAKSGQKPENKAGFCRFSSAIIFFVNFDRPTIGFYAREGYFCGSISEIPGNVIRFE